jgi:RHS repeat-associated protein
MPRGSTTQTRTFNYTSSNVVGGFLLSATNPENGTVSYVYTAYNVLGTKTDAKGQQLAYWYDTYNRLIRVYWWNAPGGAQLLRSYYYDTNPLDSTGTFSQNALGRLTAVQYPQTAAGVQMNEMYSYSQAGLPADKRLQVNQLVNYVDNNNHKQQQTVTVNLDSTYAYNNEGKLTAMTYPSTIGAGGTPVAGAGYNYIYDGMYRLGAMTDSGGTTVVSGVSYNAANQLLGMTYNGIGETRAYNVLNQLTSIVAGSSENLTYNYPTGTNNGKASSMYNALSGETVTYTYDSLNRMATAAGSGWGEAYTFDGFGNLTTKQVTAGSGPSLSVSVNPANNQIQGYGFSYDANGNGLFNNATAYDVENHVSGVGWNNGAPAVDYCYDAQNKRIFMWTAGTLDQYNNATSYSVVAYSPSGQKLGTYLFAPQQPSYQHGPYTPYMLVTLASSDQYFGGRRLAAMDQLGSAGTYYPWGEAKGGTNPQDTWSYATYWRDSATGLDYANNRYYSNAYGRFMTPDPYYGSAKLQNPTSWNRYAYVLDDPANANDPTGLVAPDCNDLLSQINEFIFGDSSGFKGIVQRYYEQIYGNFGPGTKQWVGHNRQILSNQRGLKELMTEFIDDKCPPPGNWGYIDQWANKPLPTSKDYKGPTNKPSFLQYVITGVSTYIFFEEVLPNFLEALPDLIEEVPLLIADDDTGDASGDNGYEIDASISYGGFDGSTAIYFEDPNASDGGE